MSPLQAVLPAHAAPPAAPAERPPRVRQDLELLPAEREEAGDTRFWMLHDPLSGRFFRIGVQQVELLEQLDGRPLTEIAASASASLQRPVTVEQVGAFVDFLRTNNLVEADARQQAWLRTQRERRPPWLARVARGYLFFRIPLFHPDRLLDRTLPWVRWLASPAVGVLLLVLGLSGLLLAARQADVFWNTFLHFFTPAGFAAFGVALVLVKGLHELGHAYVAKAHGCRVPVIGIAFLVLWPVLYTDTTDAWRLASRSARMRIGAAGMLVELAVAALALFAWSLAPEGPLRSVLFLLATSTWTISLLVNLNCLMRFDGYYLLSDWWRVPNLEPRASALARWWLRERLFDFGEAPPEPPRPRLIVFAFAVWIYRLFLFIGIALLVYHLFFKLAGILLFAVEIAYFVLGPVWRELREWGRRRHLLRAGFATTRTLLLLAALVTLFLVPWERGIRLPGTHEALISTVYAPGAGRLLHLDVEQGSAVKPGDLLLQVEASELDYELRQARLRADELRWQREALGFDSRLLDRALVTATELRTQAQRLASVRARRERLTVHAPIAGVVTDLLPGLRETRWLANGQRLLSIVDRAQSRITAFAGEDMLRRIRAGQAGFFYADGGGRAPLAVEVAEVDSIGIETLQNLYSASTHGGGVAVREAGEGELVPVSATYRLELRASKDGRAPERALRGTVVLQGEPQSYASRFWLWLRNTLVRESGF